MTYDKDTKRKQFTTEVRLYVTDDEGVVTYDKDTKRKQFTTIVGAFSANKRCCDL